MVLFSSQGKSVRMVHILYDDNGIPTNISLVPDDNAKPLRQKTVSSAYHLQ